MNIHELRHKPHLSASAINEYIECSMAYRFGRVDKVEPEYTSDALIFGTCIHKVLEEFHIAKMQGTKQEMSELSGNFEAYWSKANEETPNILFKEGEDFTSLLKKGQDILLTYYQHLPQDNFLVLATEEPFRIELEGIPVPIVGVMDLVEEDEGGTVIISDFKTSSRAYSKDEIDKSLQLTIYQMAAKQIGYGDRDILLRFDCLIKTRTPKFEQYYTVRTELDEQRAIKKIRYVWDGIQKGVFVPNDTSWKCGYCAFKNHCDKWFAQQEVA